MSSYTARDFESKRAGADLSAKQFYIVKADTSNEDGVVLAALATNNLMGIMMDKPASGAYGGVAMVSKGGRAPVIYGGTVTIGDLLTSDSSGKAVTTTTAKDCVLGTAAKSGVSGDIGAVDLGVGGQLVTT